MAIAKKKKTWKCYAIDLVVMGFIGALVFIGVGYLQPEPPFHSVNRVSIAKQKNVLIVSARYTEGDCNFRSLVVYGERKGKQTPLNWRSLDGYPTLDMDRAAGQRHLVLKAQTQGISYEKVVVVTKHHCTHGIVEKVFLEEDLNRFNFTFFKP